MFSTFFCLIIVRIFLISSDFSSYFIFLFFNYLRSWLYSYFFFSQWIIFYLLIRLNEGRTFKSSELLYFNHFLFMLWFEWQISDVNVYVERILFSFLLKNHRAQLSTWVQKFVHIIHWMTVSKYFNQLMDTFIFVSGKRKTLWKISSPLKLSAYMCSHFILFTKPNEKPYQYSLIYFKGFFVEFTFSRSRNGSKFAMRWTTVYVYLSNSDL